MTTALSLALAIVTRFLSYCAMPGEVPLVPFSGDEARGDAAVQRQWRKTLRLSSATDAAEAFLDRAGLERGPWLAVGFAGGIGLWFVLSGVLQWTLALLACAVGALCTWLVWRGNAGRAHVAMAIIAIMMAVVAGIAVIWARSAIVGAGPITQPQTAMIDGRVLERIEQPAEQRVRLVLATREPDSGRAIKVRLNLPVRDDRPGLAEGALVRIKARLMPPAPPMLPGAYSFARTAWFKGYAATGNVLGLVEVLETANSQGRLAHVQRALAAHIRGQLSGSPASIAAALASGDRGAIAREDEEAMRDSGLTHLLSISGLHVSAVIAATYFLTLKLLAAWPWLALRVRLPILAAGAGALAGIGYTLLTGAEVPTVRSCVGAILVLVAVALGREPLSLRLVAIAAMFVLLLWPESLVGPSFQMSFAAVIAIIALHGAAPVRAFLAPREEGWVSWLARRALMLLVTGLVIELALMPIGLFHFHRAGAYGALANVFAIPLTTFVIMPLIAFALLLDLAGMGAPVWWCVGKALELLLGIAHWTASQPGAVTLMPAMAGGTFALFIAGGLWVALWRGRVRLLGLLPIGVASALLSATPVPDILVSGDGRHVGVAGDEGRLMVLRESRSSYARDNLLELAGMKGEPVAFDDWPGADCSRDFCVVSLERGGKVFHILAARSRVRVEERALAAACDRADIVIADRWLPRNCQPRWLKADQRMLSCAGGLAIDLRHRRVTTVDQTQGHHGWWKGCEKARDRQL